MIAALLVAAARSAAMLTLDLRPIEEACPRGSAEGDIVVCAPGERLTDLLPASIDGTPAMVRIDPGGPESFECNPGFIDRAKIIGRSPYTLAQIGPIEVEGTSAQASIDIAGKRTNRLVQWTRYPATRGADCVVGPRALPFDRVRFLIGAGRPGATPQSLPFHRPSHGHTNVAWKVGRHDIAVRFSHLHDRTVLAASSTRAVAPVLGATVEGPILQEEIAWTILRPVRALKMNRPMVVAGVRIAQPYSRIRDYGNAENIRSALPEDLLDDDILVSAKRGSPGGTRLMRIGREDLARCASLTVDNKARQITIVC